MRPLLDTKAMFTLAELGRASGLSVYRVKGLLKRNGVTIYGEGTRAQSVFVSELRDRLSAFCDAVDEKAARDARHVEAPPPEFEDDPNLA